MKKRVVFTLGIIAATVLTGCASLSQGGQAEPAPTPEKEVIETGNTSVEPTGTTEGEKTVVDKGTNEEAKPSTIVKSGYEFTVPSDYGVAFSDDFGVFFYMNDIFQMRPVVVDEDQAKFDSYYDDASALTEKSINAGGKIIHEPKLDTVDGLDIFHFRVDFDGEISEVMRCRISDSASLGGNMALLSDVSENDCLHVFASIAKTAVATDAADTTIAEYVDANTKITNGEEVSDNTIGDTKKSVTYGVTEGFLYKPEYDESEDGKCEQNYGDDKFNLLIIKLINDGDDANAYVSARSNNIKTMDVDGYTYYYYLDDESTAEYTSFESVAATDVGDGYIYVVDFEAGYEYKVEDLIEFMQIKVK